MLHAIENASRKNSVSLSSASMPSRVARRLASPWSTGKTTPRRGHLAKPSRFFLHQKADGPARRTALSSCRFAGHIRRGDVQRASLWLHSSSRNRLAYLAASNVVELAVMITAPIVSFDCAVPKVPFIDATGRISPSRSSAAGYPCFRADALGLRKAGQSFRRRNIGEARVPRHGFMETAGIVRPKKSRERADSGAT
jgi:hypothetical protein